jgi:hypothetical protein
MPWVLIHPLTGGGLSAYGNRLAAPSLAGTAQYCDFALWARLSPNSCAGSSTGLAGRSQSD